MASILDKWRIEFKGISNVLSGSATVRAAYIGDALESFHKECPTFEVTSIERTN